MWGRSYFFGLLGAVVILLTASFSLSITLRHPRARIMWKYPISLDCWQPGDSCHFIYCSLRPFNHAPTPQGTDDVGAPYFLELLATKAPLLFYLLLPSASQSRSDTLGHYCTRKSRQR